MKIYVLGDSISVHYGAHLQRFLNGVCEYSRKSGEEVALLDLDNAQGANGGDSAMVRAFLEAYAQSASGGVDADLLLLNCGLHDIKTNPQTGARQIPGDAYEANLRAIVRTAAGMRPALVWLRTTPCDEAVHNRQGMQFHRFAADVVAYNTVADRVMAEAGVPVIDLYTFTLNQGPELYCDHVHFLEPIREKQAAFIAGWVAAACAPLPSDAA